MTVSFDISRDGLVLCDVEMAAGVELQLVCQVTPPRRWEVWAVKIDGRLYREPSVELEGDPLQPGAFREMLDARLAEELSRQRDEVEA